MDEFLFHQIGVSPSAPHWLVRTAILIAQDGIFVVPALMTLSWISGSRAERETGVKAALTAGLALLAAALISNTYFHPRPFMLGLARNLTHHDPDSSMPSDHATVLFALFAAYATDLRWSWVSVSIGLLAIGVAWARVFLGIHFPADILVAFVLGGLASLAAASKVGRTAAGIINSFVEVTLQIFGLPVCSDRGLN